MFPNTTKILVVDDMFTMRKVIMKSLEKMGLTNIIEASDGIKASQQINSHQDSIGLIISDWNMPNCTGIDLLKMIRKVDRYKNIPFILLTAESEIEQVKLALSSGVDGYIVKPFKQETFQEKLQAVYDKYNPKAA